VLQLYRVRAYDGISEATLYNWKAKYGGIDVAEAGRLKQLEDENARLKMLLAEQMLDAAHFANCWQKNGRARRQAPRCRASGCAKPALLARSTRTSGMK
jgi:hypothetical protein